MTTRVRFEPAGEEVAVDPPEALVDVVDEYPGAGVPLSCRSAHCAVCRVTVEAGGTALAPASAGELETLADHSSPPGARLCCQLRVVRDGARVVLRLL